MINDIKKLNRYYKVKQFVKNASNFKKTQYLYFRAEFIEEELNELFKAIENEYPDEIVDALIDIIVVALGTLDAYNINIKTAWNRVHDANMKKEVGVNESRSNSLNLPDLVKPKDWEAPQHIDNIGLLDFLLKD